MPTHPFSSRHLLIVFASLNLLLGATVAQAQTVITSLPCTISQSGTYVLNSNLSSPMISGSLITVNASNVTIDFQNHYIAGPVGNTGQYTNGVTAHERSNLTIKNGTIAFCAVGINIYGDGGATTNSVDHQIDNMRVTYCYSTGIYVAFSPASRITHCQISRIGYDGQNGAGGIVVGGANTTVEDNVVSGMVGTGSYGILTGTSSFIRRNTVSGAVSGVSGGKYQDNLTANCTTPFSGGANAGGNN